MTSSFNLHPFAANAMLECAKAGANGAKVHEETAQLFIYSQNIMVAGITSAATFCYDFLTEVMTVTQG